MIFSEVYGSYFKAVSAILEKAVDGKLSQRELTRTVLANAFGESLITIPAKLTDGSWPLITKEYGTPLQHKPHMPLTTLEKQWLKALLLDPRVRLFAPSEEGLEDVEPLFTPDQFVYFDRYADGDDFTDPRYIEHFRMILQAMREQRKLRIFRQFVRVFGQFEGRQLVRLLGKLKKQQLVRIFGKHKERWFIRILGKHKERQFIRKIGR